MLTVEMPGILARDCLDMSFLLSSFYSLLVALLVCGASLVDQLGEFPVRCSANEYTNSAEECAKRCPYAQKSVICTYVHT